MEFMEVSRRLEQWIKKEFPTGSAERVLDELRALPEELAGGPDGSDRIQASLVIRSGGDWYAFQRCLQVVHPDWRDALVGAGLGDDDWKYRLDDELGTEK